MLVGHTAGATSILVEGRLYPYEEFDFGVLDDEPLALPCLGIIGMPKFPSQPNKGVRLNFDAISNLFVFYVGTLYTRFKSWRKLY